MEKWTTSSKQNFESNWQAASLDLDQVISLLPLLKRWAWSKLNFSRASPQEKSWTETTREIFSLENGAILFSTGASGTVFIFSVILYVTFNITYISWLAVAWYPGPSIGSSFAADSCNIKAPVRPVTRYHITFHIGLPSQIRYHNNVWFCRWFLALMFGMYRIQPVTRATGTCRIHFYITSEAEWFSHDGTYRIAMVSYNRNA